MSNELSSTSTLPRRRRLLFMAAPTAIVLLLSIAGGELALRLSYEKIERITGAAPWTVESWQDLTYHWDRYDETLGWSNVPDYRSDERVPFRVTINGQGLRADREYAETPPAGVRRIAVVGDSTTFGEEVDDDQTLPWYLERHLDGAEVLNFGVHGFGIGQMMLRLERDVFPLQPDHVVAVVYLPTDIFRAPATGFSHPKPAFNLVGSELRITNLPVPIAEQQPWLFRHSFLAAWLWGRPREAERPENIDAHLELAAAILSRMDAACEERGVAFTVVNISVAGTLQAIATQPQRRENIFKMRRYLAALSLDVTDQIDFLGLSYGTHGARMVAPRAHWSETGNCMLASQVAADLVERGFRAAPAPPDCLAPGGPS